jgi:CheY-like chemotaxis protein
VSTLNPSPEAAAPNTADTARSVLLAEDDDEMRALIRSLLHRAGYELVEAHTGTALLSIIADMRGNIRPLPSVIVSDVRLPGGSGLSALRVIREYGWRMPVVLITAFCSEETLNEASRLEASIVLEKPFDLDDLRMAINCLVPPSWTVT